jgi:hypothetical protein
MDRLRARVLLAEAEALGVTIDDLVAASSSSVSSPGGGSSQSAAAVPTLAEYVETVAPSFSATRTPRRRGRDGRADAGRAARPGSAARRCPSSQGQPHAVVGTA